jgi:hypothetical protein
MSENTEINPHNPLRGIVDELKKISMQNLNNQNIFLQDIKKENTRSLEEFKAEFSNVRQVVNETFDERKKELPCVLQDNEIKRIKEEQNIIKKELKRIDSKYKFFGKIFDISYIIVKFFHKYNYQIALTIFLGFIFIACKHYHIL